MQIKWHAIKSTHYPEWEGEFPQHPPSHVKHLQEILLWPSTTSVDTWCANLPPVTGKQTSTINKHLRMLPSTPQEEFTLPHSSSLNMLLDCVNSCFLTPFFLAIAPLHLQKEPPCWQIKLSFWGCRNNSNCWLILYRTRPTQEAQGQPATRMEMFTEESRDLFVLMRGRGNVTAKLLVLNCRGAGVSWPVVSKLNGILDGKDSFICPHSEIPSISNLLKFYFSFNFPTASDQMSLWSYKSGWAKNRIKHLIPPPSPQQFTSVESISSSPIRGQREKGIPETTEGESFRASIVPG